MAGDDGAGVAMRWMLGRKARYSAVGAVAAAGALLLTSSPAAADDHCDRLQDSLEHDDPYEVDDDWLDSDGDGGLGSGGFGDDELDLDEYGDDPSDLGHYDDVAAIEECRADERAERDRRNTRIWVGVGSSSAGLAAAGARYRRRRATAGAERQPSDE